MTDATDTAREEFEQQARDQWPDPEPLPTLPEVASFDFALLPAGLRPWIEDVAERVQCPPDFPAAGAMVGLGTVIGRSIGIRPKLRDDWLVVPNLWGAIAGPPGVMKTPALSEALRFVNRLEATAAEAHADAMRAHRARGMVRDAEGAALKDELRKRAKAKAKGLEDLAREAIDAAENDPAPARRRYVTNDATVEKLGELLASNPRGLLVFRDEIVGWLAGLDREGQEGARKFYLEAWSGTQERYTYDRIGRGTIDIACPTVSVLGGIQPGPLAAYLKDALTDGARQDGLLQRFQLFVWPDTRGEWRNVDRWPDSTARTTAWEVFERLAAVDPSTLRAEPEDNQIPYLRFEPEALEEFVAWRVGLEQRLRADGEHPALLQHLAKYRSLIPSLALICHLVDAPEGGPVSVDALIRALAWGEYLEAHARRLYAPALRPEVEGARELARRIRRGDVPSPFMVRDVYRRGWRGLADPQAVRTAAELLDALGWLAEEILPTTSAGGRPAVQYYINPKAQRAPS